MTQTSPSARRTSRWTYRLLVFGLLVVIAAIIAAFGHQVPKSLTASPLNAPRHELHGAIGETDGVVPDGVTVFDDAIPAVANLDPDLLKALHQAATDVAVDIGHSDATAWLSEHGAGYGLCQIYRNEPWHYELRIDAIDRGCPHMYTDPTQDPRMHQ